MSAGRPPGRAHVLATAGLLPTFPLATCPPARLQVIESALEKAGLQKEDVDWLVMHQVGQEHVLVHLQWCR